MRTIPEIVGHATESVPEEKAAALKTWAARRMGGHPHNMEIEISWCCALAVAKQACAGLYPPGRWSARKALAISYKVRSAFSKALEAERDWQQQ